MSGTGLSGLIDRAEAAAEAMGGAMRRFSDMQHRYPMTEAQRKIDAMMTAQRAELTAAKGQKADIDNLVAIERFERFAKVVAMSAMCVAAGGAFTPAAIEAMGATSFMGRGLVGGLCNLTVQVGLQSGDALLDKMSTGKVHKGGATAGAMAFNGAVAFLLAGSGAGDFVKGFVHLYRAEILSGVAIGQQTAKMRPYYAAIRKADQAALATALAEAKKAAPGVMATQCAKGCEEIRRALVSRDVMGKLQREVGQEAARNVPELSWMTKAFLTSTVHGMSPQDDMEQAMVRLAKHRVAASIYEAAAQQMMGFKLLHQCSCAAFDRIKPSDFVDGLA